MSGTTPNLITPALESLKKAIAGLLDDTDLSDLVITCQNTSHNVHKAIVCAQSRFFKNACKKGTFKESATGVVDFPDDDQYAVRSMVEFLYTGDYAELELSTRLLHHIQIYTLADKCSIEPLKEEARLKLSNFIEKKFAVEEVDLAAATRFAYENVIPEDTFLREILIGMIVDKMHRFLDDEAGPICNLMAEMGEVGRDAVRAARHSFMATGKHIRAPLHGFNTRNFHCESCKSYWRILSESTLNVWDMLPRCLKCDAIIPIGTKDELVSESLLYSWICGGCHKQLYSSNHAEQVPAEQDWNCPYCLTRSSFHAVMLG
ncbi:Siderophore iron transporter [Venturia nashicola]|nr:Siderophore iron transporter [Venturia nashicola]